MSLPAPAPIGKHTKAVAWLILAVFFFLAGLLGLLGRSEWNPAVSVAERTAEDIATASLAVYISLRAINAALSTAQEIELGASVVGQASLQPLKVLEPVDDTVERVADVVFLVSAGAALAAVGLAPVASIGLVILGVGMLGKLGIQRYSAQARKVDALCNQGMLLGVSVGLAIPLLFALGVWLGERATAAQMNAATAELDAVAEQANILIGADELDAAELPESEDDDTGMFSWLRDQVSGARDGVAGVFEQSARYLGAARVFVEEADTILGASLTIVGILALRMLVLPVFLFFGALSLLRGIQRSTV